MAKLTGFPKWMADVDAAVYRIAGVSVYDLEDCCFYDWYEDGVKVSTAARRALRGAGF